MGHSCSMVTGVVLGAFSPEKAESMDKLLSTRYTNLSTPPLFVHPTAAA